MVEFFKLASQDPPQVLWLSTLNKDMQLAFSCTIFVLVIPTIWVAKKVEKEFGWGLYKKLGASMHLQSKFFPPLCIACVTYCVLEMYRSVQCLSLMVKVDIFFEVVFMAFLVAEIISEIYQGLAIAVLVVLAISLVLVRESIARESHILMGLFIAIQLLYIITATLILSLPDEVGETAMGLFFLDWYAFSIYCKYMYISIVFFTSALNLYYLSLDVFGMLAGVVSIMLIIQSVNAKANA